MAKLKRKDVILYLLYGASAKPISGRTRLQKMLFLLEKEYKLSSQLSSDFGFVAWRYGPFSIELLRDIEFLENVGMIKAQRAGFPSEPEKGELDALREDYLDDEGEYLADQLYVQEKFSLTEQGKRFVEEKLEARLPKQTKVAIESIRRKYNRLSLASLLRYVYSKYPKYAIKSELGQYVR